MLDQNDLQAIAALIKNEVEPIKQDISDLKINVAKMDSRLDKIETRLDNIEEDIEVIKEDCEITRDGTNNLGEWVEYYFGDVMPYPLDKEKANKEQSILNLINVIEQQKR